MIHFLGGETMAPFFFWACLYTWFKDSLFKSGSFCVLGDGDKLQGLSPSPIVVSLCCFVWCPLRPFFSFSDGAPRVGELVRLLTEQLENQKKVNTQLIKAHRSPEIHGR